MSGLREFVKLLDAYGSSLVSYAAVGLASALVEWGVFYGAAQRIDPAAASIIAFLVATTANHLLSKGRIFTSTRGPSAEFGLVLVVSGLAFLVNFAVFELLRSVAWNLYAAKVAGTGVAFAANFLLRQFYVFSPNPRLLALSRLAANVRARDAERRAQFDPR